MCMQPVEQNGNSTFVLIQATRAHLGWGKGELSGLPPPLWTSEQQTDMIKEEPRQVASFQNSGSTPA